MGSQVVVVSVIVVILGVVSAALGFSAEATKITASDITIAFGVCFYPSSPALPLALTAAAALLVSEIIVGAFTRCVCCKRAKNKSNKPLALVSSIISWVAAVIGILLFLAGASINAQQQSDVRRGELNSCVYIKPGVFAGAAGLALLSALLGVVAIVLMDSGDQNQNTIQPPHPVYYNQPQQQGGIAMGEPQIPPTVYSKDARGQQQFV